MNTQNYYLGSEFEALTQFTDLNNILLRRSPDSTIDFIFQNLRDEMELMERIIERYIPIIRENYSISPKKLDKFERSFFDLKESFQKRHPDMSLPRNLSKFLDSNLDVELELLEHFSKSLWKELEGEKTEEDIEFLTRVSIAVEEIKIILREVKEKIKEVFTFAPRRYRKQILLDYLRVESKKIRVVLEAVMRLLIDLYRLCRDGYSPEDLECLEERIHETVDLAHSRLSFKVFVEDEKVISDIPPELIA